MLIPDNLTYEQFKAYARRRPSLEGAWLYKLLHKKPCQQPGAPEFELQCDEYIFFTLDDAERYISELVKADDDCTWCFTVSQMPLGGSQSGDGAEWLYDNKGNLLDYTNTTWNEENAIESTFFGRTDDRLRFHKGDIVWVEERGMVHLAVVASDGLTVDWFWGLYNRRKGRGYPADASDDCYYVLDGPSARYHSHVPPTAIMPVLSQLPDDIKAYFDRCLEMADNCEGDPNTFVEPCRDVDFSTISKKRIYINYNREAGKHCLVLEEYDCITDRATITELPGNLSADELSQIKNWLSQVKYGKTRLWYLIREWILNNEDHDAHLPLSTTLEELLYE